MKDLLYKYFTELGLPMIAFNVLNTKHEFSLKAYCNIFLKEINRPELIISDKRVIEMKKKFYEEREKFYESIG